MASTAKAPSSTAESRDKSLAWYVPQIESSHLSAPARHLLESYSHIPADEVEKHVSEIRDEAWEIFPYPCIGGFRFLLLYQGPHYAPALARLKGGNERFLDMGCCFGQEIRRLVADGVPSEKLTGADLRPEFFELGYKLFQDKETLGSKFLVADIFDESPRSALKSLEGTMDVIYAGSFLHLFSWEQQVLVCRRLTRLWRAKAGSMLYGRQTANIEPGPRKRKVNTDGDAPDPWVHDAESFRRMWDEVAGHEGLKVKVEVEVLSLQERVKKDYETGWMTPGDRRLEFAVFRE